MGPVAPAQPIIYQTQTLKHHRMSLPSSMRFFLSLFILRKRFSYLILCPNSTTSNQALT